MTLQAYIRTQAGITAAANAVINPLLAWLGNRSMDVVALRGGNSILLDTAITSVVLTLLVTLFVASGVRRDLSAGRLKDSERVTRPRRLLARLPRRAWALGLSLGFRVALILTPVTFAIFTMLGLSGLSFPAFALFKLVYTAALGFVVARWVILREMSVWA